MRKFYRRDFLQNETGKNPGGVWEKGSFGETEFATTLV